MTDTAFSNIASPSHRAPRLNFVLVCVFLDLLGVGLVVPVLPLLVGEFVSTREGQVLWFGLLAAVFGLMQFLCMPMLGAISDRVGRRPVLLYSMGGLCLNFLATAWAPNLACLFIGRVIGGMSAASIAVASAYASDISSPAQRAGSFGKIGAVAGLGFICGPLLGGLLGGQALHLPFYVAAGLSVCNLIYGALLVPESLPAARRRPIDRRAMNPLRALGKVATQVATRVPTFAYALAACAQVMLQTTWVLYTHFRFGWGARDNGIALFVVGVASAAVQAALLGPLTRWLGERRLAFLGLASGAVAYLCYGLVARGWMMYAVIVVNLPSFATAPALQALISTRTSAQEQGETQGALQAINSLGFMVMPLLAAAILAGASGLASTDWRLGGVFFVGAAIQCAALLVAWRHLARS
jgi:DHA1 family tetracycline resistance protein-like MFS transporter